MGINPFECPKCGGVMFNDLMRYGYRCLSCGNHVPYESMRVVNGHGGEAAPGAGADRGAGAQAGGSEGGSAMEPTAARPAVVIELESSTLQMLAKIIGDAYNEIEITRLLVDSGHKTIGYGGGTRRQFLYKELELLQDRRGYRGVLEFLRRVCSSPGRNDGIDVQGDINACLDYYRLGIGSQGEIVDPAGARGRTSHGGENGGKTARPMGAQGRMVKGGNTGLPVGGQAQLDDDGQAFDRRGYHKLVIRHAREKFLKGEYFSAVTECCKAFEELVQKKSGIDDCGADLMGRAFGSEGALTVSFPGLKGETRENMRRGLLHLCQGIVANVRNPVSHELELKFRMGREDALDILGTISYLCRLVERTRRRPGRITPKNGRRGTKKNEAKGKCTPKAPRGEPDGGNAAKEDGAGGSIVSLSVSPESVVQGDTATVTATGRGIDGWYVSILSEEGRLKSRPTRLGAYGATAGEDGGTVTYEFHVSMLNYEPGEYRVSVSSGKNMDSDGMRIKKFLVHTYEDMLDAIRGHPGRV